MNKCIIHNYEKISNTPLYTLIDNNMEVGVYKCKCSVCGKKKEKRFFIPQNKPI